jgi:hypothetical protein
VRASSGCHVPTGHSIGTRLRWHSIFTMYCQRSSHEDRWWGGRPGTVLWLFFAGPHSPTANGAIHNLNAMLAPENIGFVDHWFVKMIFAYLDLVASLS